MLIDDPEIVKITDLDEEEKELVNLFSCGKEQIDSYLKDDAYEDTCLGLTKTFIFLSGSKQKKRMLGYFSLVADRVQVINKSKIKGKMKNTGYDFFGQKDFIPGIQIHHFAVGEEYKGKGIGSNLMNYVLAFIKLFILTNIGACLITVQSEKDVTGFYEKIGFSKTGQTRDVNTSMAILTRELF